MTQTDDQAALVDAIRKSAERHLATKDVSQPKQLSGGASQQLWSFNATVDGKAEPLIMRRSVTGEDKNSPTAISLSTEAAVLQAVHKTGAQVPAVRYVLTPQDDLGPGYVMQAVQGESIARKILRDDEFAHARTVLAQQCGTALAKLHEVDVTTLPELPISDAAAQLKQYIEVYDSFDEPHPVFELAFKYLEQNLPAPVTPRLVHGDFRNGNIMVTADGLNSILDWELCHLGDPMEDLGWVCVTSWRFGQIDKPVGGFGDYDQLFAGYEAHSGIKVDPARVKFWEMFGVLKWGIMCMLQKSAHTSGLFRSVERAAIGRRASETELDLLTLMKQD